MIDQLTHNWLCWAIIAVAMICYQQLFLQFLTWRQVGTEANHQRQTHQNSLHQMEFSSLLIAALPLMGLLGTIIGLLDCFAGIAGQGANGDLVSGGIADALLTTQLGLVCAIPGWLLLAWTRSTIPNINMPEAALR